MALSGVRISWLILARKSDFADEACSAWRLALSSSSSVFFQSVMSRSTAQSLSPSLDAAHRHEQRHQAALRRAADRPRGPSLSRRRVPACRRRRDSRSAARWLSGANSSRTAVRSTSRLVIAEQLRRAAIDRHARGRRGRAPRTPSVAASRMSRSSPASVLALRSAASKVFCRSSSVHALPTRSASAPARFALPRRGEQPRHRPASGRRDGGDGQRLRAVAALVVVGRPRFDEQRVEPARLFQRMQMRRSRSSRGRRGWRRSDCRADRPERRPAAGRGSAADRRRRVARRCGAVRLWVRFSAQRQALPQALPAPAD